jgi:hypothetical protein
LKSAYTRPCSSTSDQVRASSSSSVGGAPPPPDSINMAAKLRLTVFRSPADWFHCCLF